ncbi:MAG TPA: capsule assembly Wzi family protein, partial [Longimicrobium sp.]|nr:capsule assembly Wzi family protein [Longimicrobium sp.]
MTHLPLSTFRAAGPLLAAAAFALASAPLAAQDTLAVDTVARAASAPASIPDEVDAPSPLIEAGHWAVRAAARAEALGLTTHYLPAQRSVPRAAVERALREAAERAAAERPELAALTAGWHARFLEEFREFRPESAWRRAAVAPLAGRWSLGGRSDEGRLSPARGLVDFRQPAVALPDEDRAFALSEIGVGLGRFAVADVELVGELGDGDEGLDAHRWEVAVGAGAWRLGFGEEPVGYGYGGAGGVVLSSTPMPRVELQTSRPVRLPWVLSRLGDASFHTFVSRMDEARHPGDPWMWGARASFQPHPR